jgi:hypothetical protein
LPTWPCCCSRLRPAGRCSPSALRAGYLARAGYQSRKEKKLTVRGPYRYNRNPYYLAHMTMDLGFFCMAGLPWLAVIYMPVIFFVYRRRVLREEPFLEAEFGEDYRLFARDVPRWGLRLPPAAGRGHEQKFEWSLYRLNREWPRSRSHLIFWLIFLGYFLYGNPLLEVSMPLRAMIFTAFAGWLAVHDIYPQDERSRPGWWLPAVAGAVAGALWLRDPTLWQRWPEPGLWVALGLGFVGLVAVAYAAHAAWSNQVSRSLTRVVARPMTLWYLAGLGLGLVSGTPGGIWLGILLPLLAWAGGLAGAFKPSTMQPAVATGLGVIAAVSLVLQFSLVP